MSNKVNCSAKWSDWKCNAICPGNSIEYTKNTLIPTFPNKILNNGISNVSKINLKTTKGFGGFITGSTVELVPAKMTRTLNIINQPKNGGLPCPILREQTKEELCSTQCFDCIGGWQITTPCDAVCPGNAVIHQIKKHHKPKLTKL